MYTEYKMQIYDVMRTSNTSVFLLITSKLKLKLAHDVLQYCECCNTIAIAF